MGAKMTKGRRLGGVDGLLESTSLGRHTEPQQPFALVRTRYSGAKNCGQRNSSRAHLRNLAPRSELLLLAWCSRSLRRSQSDRQKCYPPDT